MDHDIGNHETLETFGDLEAVSGPELRVRKGSICASWDKMGPGKTTRGTMLVEWIRPSQGRGHILGLRIETRMKVCAIRAARGIRWEDKTYLRPT